MNNQSPLNVVWTDSKKVTEHTITDVEQAVEVTKSALNPDVPTMMEFFDSRTGLSLAIGIGRTHTVVTFQESLDPPYYVSLGDINREGVTSFYYGNEETEYPLRNAVSVEQGQQALAFFVKNRSKPTNINWEKL